MSTPTPARSAPAPGRGRAEPAPRNPCGQRKIIEINFRNLEVLQFPLHRYFPSCPAGTEGRFFSSVVEAAELFRQNIMENHKRKGLQFHRACAIIINSVKKNLPPRLSGGYEAPPAGKTVLERSRRGKKLLEERNLYFEKICCTGRYAPVWRS